MEEVKKVWRKKIAESKTRIYYVTTNGNFYYIDKRTQTKHYIKPNMCQGKLTVSLGNNRKGTAKNLMAKAFLGAKYHDMVVQINGDIYDFSLENLRVTSKAEVVRKMVIKRQEKRRVKND